MSWNNKNNDDKTKKRKTIHRRRFSTNKNNKHSIVIMIFCFSIDSLIELFAHTKNTLIDSTITSEIKSISTKWRKKRASAEYVRNCFYGKAKWNWIKLGWKIFYRLFTVCVVKLNAMYASVAPLILVLLKAANIFIRWNMTVCLNVHAWDALLCKRTPTNMWKYFFKILIDVFKSVESVNWH